ncbi:MAG TPA: helix-turn-helix transcriptional regulator [Stellaceae bacterium]|nr:helix-turn-helix transcriptional regulator [Stellaceae bacterium]
MPGSVTSVFSEPGDFEAALREEGGLGLLITGRGRFRARLTQITLDHLRILAAEEHLARIAFFTVPADMVLIALPVGGGPAPIWGGIGMQAGEIITLGPDQRLHARTDGPCRWGIIRWPAEELTRYGRALLGAMPAIPPFARRWRPAPAAKAHLRSFHAAAVRMAKVHPEILIGREAAHGLEQQLIHALVDCLSAGPLDEDVSADRHRDILARFEGVLEMQPFLRVAEICAVLGVSVRVLRRCCEEQLGMTPSSYLGLCRMQQVHRALRSGELEAAGVAEVARRYGVRDLGRFTAGYRAFYGELPSATLRRGADRGVAELVLGRPRVKFS